MKIKEIAEAYGVEYETLHPDVMQSICFNQENQFAFSLHRNAN